MKDITLDVAFQEVQDDEFITLVKEMRAAQKRYFKNRMRTDLEQAKRLENLVDLKLRELQ